MSFQTSRLSRGLTRGLWVYISLNTKVRPKTTFSPLRTGWCFCVSHVPLRPHCVLLTYTGLSESLKVDKERADCDTQNMGSFSHLELAIQWWVRLNGMLTILCSVPGFSATSPPLFFAYNGGVVRFNHRCIHPFNHWPVLSVYKAQYCKHSLKRQRLARSICYKQACYLGRTQSFQSGFKGP